jgi:hypothetical protein
MCRRHAGRVRRSEEAQLLVQNCDIRVVIDATLGELLRELDRQARPAPSGGWPALRVQARETCSERLVSRRRPGRRIGVLSRP